MLIYHAEAAVKFKPGSLLVKVAMKEEKCFQLLNENDIFRCHQNPKLIYLLLTFFPESYIPTCFLDIFAVISNQHI